MGFVMNILSFPLGILISVCYNIINNYAFTILIFTVITKFILLPVSIWVHKNGIKMVRMMPKINMIKVSYFGDGDRIAQEQEKLYKAEKYNPFASLIPLFVQIVLLMGLIGAIYHPLDNLIVLDKSTSLEISDMAANFTGIDKATPSIQLTAINDIKSAHNEASYLTIIDVETIDSIKMLNFNIGNISLAGTPVQDGGMLWTIPILAGLSALILSLSQNKINPLQAEQSVTGKIGTSGFSVGLSLFLGAFVPAGVGLYWIVSNLLTIFQQLFLNSIIDPKKEIDYEKLDESKKVLRQLNSFGSKKKCFFAKDNNFKREKNDYKRFFSVANKHLVFYSEKNGFYKYFQKTIEFLLESSNVTIHYVTSDPNDDIFEMAKLQPKIRPYYIGEKKLITLFMKMDADIVVMTMPDLDTFHYKRSYVRTDIEYIYIFHYPLSTHMVLDKKALNSFDTIMCIGEFQFKEIRVMENVYDLKEKNLVACGYGQMELLYDEYKKLDKVKKKRPKILIAPSWQEDNILNSCIDNILEELLGNEFDIVVRPHPEYIKRYKEKMDMIVSRYDSYIGENLSFELDFLGNDSIFNSDIVITDWSGTAYEFAFVTLKPAVFINTTKKVNNLEYERLKIIPLEISLRDKVGIQIELGQIADMATEIKILLNSTNEYAKTIEKIRDEIIANFGDSGRVSGLYILNSLKEKKFRNS